MSYILILLITLVLAAKPKCTSKHQTTYYLEHSREIPQSFYYPKTVSTEEEHCTPTKNQELRNFYNVGRSDHVEHIIDSANGPVDLIDCDKNIGGNLVIVDAIWNQQVGQLCWADAEAEKRKVYGDVIVSNAYQAVKECCKSKTNITIFNVCLGIFAIFAIAGLVAYSPRYMSLKDQLKYEQVSVGVPGLELTDLEDPKPK